MKIKTKPDIESVGKYMVFIESCRFLSDLNLFLKKNNGLFSKFYINSIFENKIKSYLNIIWLGKKDLKKNIKKI